MTEHAATHAAIVDSPAGSLVAVVDEVGSLVRIELPGRELPGILVERFATVPTPSSRCRDGLAETSRQLAEYFRGERRAFEIPLAPRGTTFQKAVWGELRRIPFGQTRSYGEIATRLGNPRATRAVGAANGANPIPIVIPCHRVIGANGSLTGFGGGLAMKELLLGLEGSLMPDLFGQTRGAR